MIDLRLILASFIMVSQASLLPSDDEGLHRSRREVTVNDRSNCNTGDPVPSTREDTSERLARLREKMKEHEVDAYVITSDDEHQNEYVAPADQRRRFISGFSGSAGVAVVLRETEHALWTDGRYFLQADDELDCSWILMKELNEGVPTITEWLKEKLSGSSTIGLDARLVSASAWKEYEKDLEGTNVTLTPVEENLVDAIWPIESRPPRPADQIFIHELEFAGKRWEDKVLEARHEMRTKKVDLLVVTALDEIAWLLNLRGNDIPYTPTFRSYIILDQRRVKLFIEPGRISPEVDHHLRINSCTNGLCVETFSYKSILNQLRGLAAKEEVTRVFLPKKYAYAGGASYAVFASVPEEKRVLGVSPILLAKARKNDVEFQGMKKAHLKDSTALADFFGFLEEEMEKGSVWTEISASQKVAEFRAEQADFVGMSFETISAYGPNAAVIHYRPSNGTNRQILKDSTYLLDSGGQYKDGTTDITRTMHYGTPSSLEREAYTRVLMGAIDLAMLTFPVGTGDTDVDILARRPLYEVGLDYNHGTGHGIGMFLNIHESPTQIRVYGTQEHELEVGHFFSDEPGFYKDGEFGIRLETIMAVVPRQTKYKSFKKMLGLEAVSLVPFEPKLIDVAMLNLAQCRHLNEYHSKVRRIVGEMLQKQERTRGYHWLLAKTKPLPCGQALPTTPAIESKRTIPDTQAVKLENKPSGAPSLTAFLWAPVWVPLVCLQFL